MGSYTSVNLLDLDDAAQAFGFGDYQESRFANEALGCRQTGLAYHRIKPGQRSPVAHRHARQEELYVVVRGNGAAKLDGEIVPFRQWDAFRVDADVVRGSRPAPREPTSSRSASPPSRGTNATGVSSSRATGMGSRLRSADLRAS
ncbi:MAG: cupin domain-containing protein [Actinomycetota bacterium]|nr:cupin domain-containing protein [Actinomycetota bacterium]